jgi:hypothetical protein
LPTVERHPATVDHDAFGMSGYFERIARPNHQISRISALNGAAIL